MKRKKVWEYHHWHKIVWIKLKKEWNGNWTYRKRYFYILQCKCWWHFESRTSRKAIRQSKCKLCWWSYIHWMSGTRLYRTWLNMLQRCGKYKNYMHVRICNEWKWEWWFVGFMDRAIVSGYKENLTIDRIDNDWDYCPENCRRATMKEQWRNRTNNVTWKWKTISYRLEKNKITWNAYTSRLSRWWPIKKILTTPSRVYKRSN